MYDSTAQIVGLEGGHSVPRVSRSQARKLLVLVSAVKRSIGSTIGFHNHGEGPY